MEKAAEREPDAVGYFGGVMNDRRIVAEYPCWRYHRILEPVLVKNAEEDELYRQRGYDDPRAPMMANKNLVNWFWDIEDFSPKQLVCFAKEEYGVDLPIEAGQEKLMKCVFELGRWAPQNRNRLVLLAHTMKMNYDATLEQIREMITWGEKDGYEMTEETREVML